MKSVIIVQNGGSEGAIEEHFKALRVKGTEVILIGKSRPSFATESFKFIPVGNSSMSSCLGLGLGMASGDTVVFLDGRSTFKSSSLAQFIESLDDTVGVIYCGVEAGDEIFELTEDSAEGILYALTNDFPLPASCVAIRSDALPENEMPEGRTSNEITAKLMIHAISSAETVMHSSVNVVAEQRDVIFDMDTRASCLKCLISAANIEEMFPNHDWRTHEKESAAASYHTLAALFIRLGDSESALECLRLSDQLEDSPRSLALKGLIALDKGEILGAVANMVSSLQQYELRKKENEAHYSRFQPENLEVINDNLNAGLAALNKRDNERALNHFAEAVFNFDSFFSTYGVARLRAA